MRDKVRFDEAMTPAAAYENVARWHEEEVARMLREIAKGEDWSAEHNDGRRDLAGLFVDRYRDELIPLHKSAARKFRRISRRLLRRRQSGVSAKASER